MEALRMGYGYTGKILIVDLSNGRVGQESTIPYSNLFLGGRGIAAKIYWDRVDPQIDELDAENPLIFMTGPLCGFPGLAGSRWQLCGKSPLRNHFSYANFGGPWGNQLKRAGYDGLIVTGKADNPVYLVIEKEKVEIKSVKGLVGEGAISTRNILKSELGERFRIIAVGPAGENLVKFATLLTDDDTSGAGGFGAVFGSKNLKAIAVKGDIKPTAAHPEELGRLREELRKIKAENLVLSPYTSPKKLKKRVCTGCINGCWRSDYHAEDGQKGKYMCQSGFFYIDDANEYHQTKKTDVAFKANKLCDEYGVDTRVIETMILWLKSCYSQQLINDDTAELLLSKIGSLDFMEDLLDKISFRRGFGDVLAEGARKAAAHLGKQAEDLVADHMALDGELETYGPRIFPLNGLLYATEPRQPIQQLHEISIPITLWAFQAKSLLDTGMTAEVLKTIASRFWGSEEAADFSTNDGNALAAVTIQNRQYFYESLILCNFSWPITHTPDAADPVGDPTMEKQIVSAVLGEAVEHLDLYETGERIFNLQRAILLQEGWKGRQTDVLPEYNYNVPIQSDTGNADCIVPGKDGEILSHKGRVASESDFTTMLDQYYVCRGWNENGLQSRERLVKLDLADIAENLEEKGLLAS